MDIDDLRALLTVLEHGSFQAAAQATNQPRSSLRRRIDNLEAALGVPLLVRHATGVVPTPSGRMAADRGRALVLEAGALVGAVRKMETEMRVLVPVGFPPHFLALAFGLVRERLPNLRVHWGVHEDPVHAPGPDPDVIFHFGPLPATGAWTSTTLYRTPEHLIASEDWIAEHGTPRDIGDLARHPLLVWKPPGEDGMTLPLRAGGAARITPAFISSDVHLLRCLAATGFGLAYLPDGGLPDPGPALIPVLPDIVGRDQVVRALIPAAVSSLPGGERLLSVIKELAQVMSMMTP